MSEQRRARLARVVTDLPRGVGVLAIVVFAVAWIRAFRVGRLSASEIQELLPVVIVTALSGVAITWLLRATDRGRRVPAAALLVLTAPPWVVAIAVGRAATALALEPQKNPDMLAGAFRGLFALWMETAGRAVGAGCTAALAGALAIGLAFRALASAPPKRAPTRATTGTAPTVNDGMRVHAIVAAPATLVAFVAAVSAVQRAALVRGGLAAIWERPLSRPALLMDAATAFRVCELVSAIGAVALGVASLILLARSLRSAVPTRREMLSGAATVLVALTIVIGARVVDHVGTETLAQPDVRPWRRVASFQPLLIRSSDHHVYSLETTVASPSTLHPLQGGVIPLRAGEERLADALRAARAADEEHNKVPRPRLTAQPSWHVLVSISDEIPAVTVAIDARLGAADLRALLDASSASGASALAIVGNDTAPSPAMRELEEEIRSIAMLLRPRAVHMTLLLESALPPGYAADDARGWDATVRSAPRGQLTARAEPTRTRMPVPSASTAPWRVRAYFAHDSVPLRFAYLTLADDATGESLAAYVEAALQQGLQPILVTRDLRSGQLAPN